MYIVQGGLGVSGGQSAYGPTSYDPVALRPTHLLLPIACTVMLFDAHNSSA